jgi:hypothetical protein
MKKQKKIKSKTFEIALYQWTLKRAAVQGKKFKKMKKIIITER